MWWSSTYNDVTKTYVMEAGRVFNNLTINLIIQNEPDTSALNSTLHITYYK